MSSEAEALSLIAAALLGGIRTVYAKDAIKDEKTLLQRLFRSKVFFISSGIWLIACVGNWYLSAFLGGGFYGVLPQNGNISSARFADMLLTYLLLTYTDMKKKIVPDGILLVFFISQLLMAFTGMEPAGSIECLVGGAVFSLFLLGAGLLLRGRLGMGDIKLLAVTAMTAGWLYTLWLILLAMGLSFIGAVWFIVFRKFSLKTEIPFVPYLTAGMLIHIIILIS